MEAREFRIGNLVMGVRMQKPVVVDWLVLKHIQDDGNIQSAHLPNGGGPVYAPIPLTPEILLASGFVFTDLGDNAPYEIYSHTEYSGFEVWDFNGENWVLDMADLALMPTKFFKYVHQLQNMFFALSNEELTISL
jgi:hypothetical protein